jgi:beta-galactosidase
LPPGPLQTLLPIKVSRVESLRPGHVEHAGPYKIGRWLEHIETDLPADITTEAGHGLMFSQDNIAYLACWPCALMLRDIIAEQARKVGLATVDLPEGLRLRRRGDLQFAINYAPDAIDLSAVFPDAATFDYHLGAATLPPAGIAAWRIR